MYMITDVNMDRNCLEQEYEKQKCGHFVSIMKDLKDYADIMLIVLVKMFLQLFLAFTSANYRGKMTMNSFT